MLSQTPLPLLLPLLLLLPLHSADSPPYHPASAYEALRLHGLPFGLLPKGIQLFRIDTDGRFEAHLNHTCTVHFKTQVHYERRVASTLSFDQIASLSGVAAQELFLWFPVRFIRVDIPSTGLIYFDVCVIRKQFSLSLFESPPDCSPSLRRDCEVEDGGEGSCDSEFAAVLTVSSVRRSGLSMCVLDWCRL